MRRTLMETEHEDFRASVRSFVEKEMVPHVDEWAQAHKVSRDLFTAAGENGFLSTAVPEEYGGGGIPDFRFNAILSEETAKAGVAGPGLGLTLHTDICMPYFLHLTNDEQKQRWLPGIGSGEIVTAVAMTEPGIGSDLASMSTTARREGEKHFLAYNF